ncbi:hypothetical protein O9929_05295 [Vibrio lentus]|nr:hypothetical protein [Vibrio lentus]
MQSEADKLEFQVLERTSELHIESSNVSKQSAYSDKPKMNSFKPRKLAVLGQMSASIGHEAEQPVSGYSQLCRQWPTFSRQRKTDRGSEEQLVADLSTHRSNG